VSALPDDREPTDSGPLLEGPPDGDAEGAPRVSVITLNGRGLLPSPPWPLDEPVSVVQELDGACPLGLVACPPAPGVIVTVTSGASVPLLGELPVPSDSDGAVTVVAGTTTVTKLVLWTVVVS
jgi:hypothetical protein